MYLHVFPLIAILLLVSLLQPSSFRTVIISFVSGEYDPSIIQHVGGIKVQELKQLGMVKAIVPPGAIDSLEQNPAIEFVETDNQFEIAGEIENATSVEYSSSWGLQDIGIEPINSINETGKGVKIAVLDTGIDYNHPELAPAYKGGYDFINRDEDPLDDGGHGTHVAGIIAAAKDGKGVVGVAPDADLYALKVADSKGKGTFGELVEGINWSIEHHMDIITMSITGEGGSGALQKAAEIAYKDHNIVLVSAVGNGAGQVLYPAAYDQVIGVGSVDKDNKLSSFSDTGSEVELVAPGSFIKSTWIGGKYMVMSGTSMAAPFVTGSVALLLGSDEKEWCTTVEIDCDDHWTNDKVRAVLKESAKDLGEKGKDDRFGYGLVQLDFLKGSEKLATCDQMIRLYELWQLIQEAKIMNLSHLPEIPCQ